MGFLSDSAAKAFERRPRRAYIPEWFKPASYVAAGLLGVAVVFLGLVQSRATDVPNATSSEPVAGTPVTASTAPDPTIPGPGEPASTPTNAQMVTVPVRGGGQTQLPFEALLLGQRAARALFTGQFGDIPIADGLVAPLPFETWPNPVAGNVEAVLVFPDGSFSAAFPVDPDGSGPESARVVDVSIAPTSNGWVFAPVQ